MSLSNGPSHNVDDNINQQYKRGICRSQTGGQFKLGEQR